MPDVTFGAVSLQLRVLSEAGLVTVARRGAPAVLQRQARASGRRGPRARVHVVRRAVEAEAARRVRSHPPRAPPAAPQGEPSVMTETPLSTQTLPYSMDRRVVIAAPRELVFRYFTDSERWARWWGKGSTIDPRPEGEVNITHPNGVQMGGRVVEIDPPEKIVFTYGYRSGTPIPEGGSLVTIRLDEHAEGTELNLSHAFAETSMRDRAHPGLALPTRGLRQRHRQRGAWRRRRGRRLVVRGLVRARHRDPRIGAGPHRLARRALPRSIQPDRRPGRPSAAPGGGAQVHAGDARHA